MTAKCANPACNQPFRYFRSGKIFLIDLSDPYLRSPGERTKREMEYFWLCGECSRSFCVVLDKDGAVTIEQIVPANGRKSDSVPIEAQKTPALLKGTRDYPQGAE
jgi:hypothetical protein